jgi:hypothetical protein
MQETRTFVRLTNLLNVGDECETAEDKANWMKNVLNSVGTEGYCLECDESGGEVTGEFTCDEMEFVSVDVYDFMGSAYEQERFYARDIVVFKHKGTGDFYVLNAEDLWDF